MSLNYRVDEGGWLRRSDELALTFCASVWFLLCALGTFVEVLR